MKVRGKEDPFGAIKSVYVRLILPLKQYPAKPMPTPLLSKEIQGIVAFNLLFTRLNVLSTI